MQRHPSMRQSGLPNNGRLDKREGPTMTNLKDNAAAPPRTTVRIPTASGDELEAWLCLPKGDGPHPAVVMAHGIGGIKAGGLAPFAEPFREEGFVAIAFDYRNFGGSGGKPRQVLSLPRQRAHYSTVIGCGSEQTYTPTPQVNAWCPSFPPHHHGANPGLP